MWDPHTPYRAAESYGDPFADEPVPDWLTEDIRGADWARGGPHSAQECSGFAPKPEMLKRFPRQPQQISDTAMVRKMFDGYDTGVLVSDDYVGRIMNLLADLSIDDDVVIMLSSDHGETLGELNVYGDHQTADQITTHIPMMIRWPGITTPGSVNDGMHYQVDISATMLELLGQKVPSSWDGISFADALRAGEAGGRSHLVVSQGAWTCQRGVRFDDFLLLQTLHDGYHLYDDVMLFDVRNDPHETRNLLTARPEVVARGEQLLNSWYAEMMVHAARGRDPLLNVIAEGGPYHVRGQLKDYLLRLRGTGRQGFADALETKYVSELSL